MLLTRSERNIVAQVFAGFLFNPFKNFYPRGVEKVLKDAGVLQEGEPPLKHGEVHVAYEAQLIDLLFLPDGNGALEGRPKPTVTRTAFDIVVKHRNSLTSFEIKFLTRWSPKQLQIELDDCRSIKEFRGYSSCDLVLLYPSWRRLSSPQWHELSSKVRTITWENIWNACRGLPGGARVAEWMNSIKVPARITINGVVRADHKGLLAVEVSNSSRMA